VLREAKIALLQVDRKSILQTPNTIATLKEQDFQNFVKQFKSEMFIHCLLEGNISPSETADVGAILKMVKYSQLKNRPISPSLLIFPSGEKVIRIKSNYGGKDCNNIVLNMYQLLEQSRKSLFICWIVANLMNTPVFQNLRIQQQLGYVVFVSPPYGFPTMFQIGVVFPKYKQTLCSVNEKIDKFLVIFYDEHLSKMTDKDYQGFKTTVNLLNLFYTILSFIYC